MTGGRLAFDEDPVAFARDVTPFLERNEAVHNLLLGLTARAAREGDGDVALMAAWRLGGEVAAVAWRTVGHNLLLSLGWERQSLGALAARLAERREALPGVLGDEATCDRFLAAWLGAGGEEMRPVMRERIFRLEQVRAVARPPGAARVALEADRPLLEAWQEAFAWEATRRREPEAARRAVDQRLPATADRGAFLWDAQGRAVSLACYSGPTRSGIRVGPVYTPPEARRQGYATALVAALSRHLLARGRRACFLYTDLANPTSNHVYTAIGYGPVADVVEYRTGPP